MPRRSASAFDVAVVSGGPASGAAIPRGIDVAVTIPTAERASAARSNALREDRRRRRGRASGSRDGRWAGSPAEPWARSWTECRERCRVARNGMAVPFPSIPRAVRLFVRGREGASALVHLRAHSPAPFRERPSRPVASLDAASRTGETPGIMSASDGKSADSHAHGAHGTPPAPPEPHTPAWLTLLGVVLFLVAGLAWGLSSPSSSSDGSGATAAPAAD